MCGLENILRGEGVTFPRRGGDGRQITEERFCFNGVRYLCWDSLNWSIG